MESTKSRADSTFVNTKFKIQQYIPDGQIVKGPQPIRRIANLNAIVIKRRYGEGSTPLFSRDDITVNQEIADSHDRSISSQSSSSEASTIERYRHRDRNRENKKSCSPSPVKRRPIGKNPYNRDEQREGHSGNLPSRRAGNLLLKSLKKCSTIERNRKRRSIEKIPYYRDEQREKDRLRRLYGPSRSGSPSPGSITKRCLLSKERHRRRSISKERSRRRSISKERHLRRSISKERPHRRSISKDRHRRSSISKERHRSSHTPLRTYSPRRSVPTPAAYPAYSFPSWSAAQPPWFSSPNEPYVPPYSMWPIMPPMRHPNPLQYARMPSLPYMPMTVQHWPRAAQRHSREKKNS